MASVVLTPAYLFRASGSGEAENDEFSPCALNLGISQVIGFWVLVIYSQVFWRDAEATPACFSLLLRGACSVKTDEAAEWFFDHDAAKGLLKDNDRESDVVPEIR